MSIHILMSAELYCIPPTSWMSFRRSPCGKCSSTRLRFWFFVLKTAWSLTDRRSVLPSVPNFRVLATRFRCPRICTSPPFVLPNLCHSLSDIEPDVRTRSCPVVVVVVGNCPRRGWRVVFAKKNERSFSEPRGGARSLSFNQSMSLNLGHVCGRSTRQ